MSVMNVNYRRVSDPRWIAENIEIVRSNGFGSAQCVACGCSPLTQRELADALGVPLSAFSSFLHRGVGRTDVVARITRGIKRIRKRDEP